jgi:hypothetical protein
VNRILEDMHVGSRTCHLVDALMHASEDGFQLPDCLAAVLGKTLEMIRHDRTSGCSAAGQTISKGECPLDWLIEMASLRSFLHFNRCGFFEQSGNIWTRGETGTVELGRYALAKCNAVDPMWKEK